MNIGIFTDTYYPQINGVVTSIRMLEKELNKLGHKVFIFTTTDPQVTYAVPRVFRMPSMPLFFSPSHRVTLLYSPKLLMNMKYLKLDIIHTETEFPIGVFGKIVSELFKIPMVHTYHTMYEDYVHYIANGHLITPKGAQRYSRFFCNRARAVVAPTEKTRDYLVGSGVARPIHIIPTGLDFSPFHPDRYNESELNNTKTELGIHVDDPLVVIIGRLAKEKSVDVIINQIPRLLAKLPRTKFLVVGDGPMREPLETMSKRLGIQDAVIFAGSRPWDVIGKYYRLGDIFVTASTSEAQGLTYLESMAAKVPVVVKKDRSVESLITHGETGYCFEKDEEAADIMYHALTHPEEGRQIAEKGYQAISHLSSDHFAKSMEALYLNVIREYR